MKSSISAMIALFCFLAAIAATVLAFVLILPEKRKDKLPAFFVMLRNFLSFKYLVIEKVMQALYIFSTAFIILYGFFSMFTSMLNGYDAEDIILGFFAGLLVMVLGPIAIRLMYEGMMLIILLVKNVMQINAKLKNQNENGGDTSFGLPNLAAKKPATPVAPQTPTVTQATPAAPQRRYCSTCGAVTDEFGNCPNGPH